MTTWFDTEWDYGFAKGLDTLIQSVERLRNEQPKRLFPAHGPVIRNAAAQLETYTHRLVEFRAAYVRGYPVFDSKPEERDAISTPTPVPLISKVTPHLYKLSHQTQGRNFAIIVADSGKGLVLDCGLLPAAQLEEIIVGMRAHLGLKEIDAFWISHMHGDHFLLGPMLREKYGAKAWTLDMIADRCEHPRNYDYAALVSAYSDGFDGMAIDRRIKPGERIDWEGLTLQVDWMPGQTEFGCCLWLELDGKRIAFTGDNLFGNAHDPSQDGHEAVVARNSAIPEEGYLYAADYLTKLKPDIIMGSHSYVMHDPAAFIERYRDWALKIIRLYKQLLPDDNYEFLFDPYWVSAAPYRVDLSSQNSAKVEVTVRNFRNKAIRYRILLQTPPGISATPHILEGEVPPLARIQIPVQLTIERSQTLQPLELIPFDITLDQQRYGQWFDFLVKTQN
jgi:glyoxylase-like metal-dependent hydrolase (beta-lactamase superfamily II)